METLFVLLVLASFTFLVIGIFKPKTSLFWDKTNQTRKKSALVYGGLTILFFILFGVTTDKSNVHKKTVIKTESSDSIKQKETKIIEKQSLFDNPNDLILKLSENGIGELKEWKNPFDMGWGSITDYYQFGDQKDGVGIQNNIAYYVEGSETKATKLYINLNINNPSDKKNALKFLNEVAEKTFSSLDIPMPTELTNAILKSEKYKKEIDGYVISNELEKSNIETWKVNIERK